MSPNNSRKALETGTLQRARVKASPSLGARLMAEDGCDGFTLLEVMVVIIITLIAGAIVTRFYRDSYHTYSQQEQIEDRNQNANFTVSKMVEILQQVGANLPDSGWGTLTYSRGVLTLGSNPANMVQFNGSNQAYSKYIAVDDASHMRVDGQPLHSSTHILIDSVGSGGVLKVAIDTNYNGGGFVKGIKDNPNLRDSIYLVTGVSLKSGDILYAYREDEYLVVNDSLVIRPNGNSALQMVLAENIDSLGFTFLDASGNVTNNWKDMRSAKLTVRARTSMPDPRISPPGYHKISLPMNVILRNKV